jgi:DUF1680 family protein
VRLSIDPAQPARFPVFLRIPEWAGGAAVTCNGAPAAEKPSPGSYLRLERQWDSGDEVSLEFPMSPRVHRRTQSAINNKTDILGVEYFAVSRGPLAYATGLIDGYKKTDTVRLPEENPERLFHETPAPQGFDGPALALDLPGRTPIVYLPFYEAGGRSPGNWRITWLQAAWQ